MEKKNNPENSLNKEKKREEKENGHKKERCTKTKRKKKCNFGRQLRIYGGQFKQTQTNVRNTYIYVNKYISLSAAGVRKYNVTK
jgi:hypothetical protein